MTLAIRHETHRDPRAGEGVVLAYASDLHLGRNDHERAIELYETLAAIRPDAVLLGGDLVDAPRGHELLEALVRDLSTLAPVLAVPGNHDVFWGVEAVERAVTRGGGSYVTDRSVRVPAGGGAVALSGDLDALAGESDATRVLVGHDPVVFDDLRAAHVDLVLAGHLHGGQVVLAQRGELLYPGAVFYRYCGLRFARGSTTMLVSRGVGDTLPIRFRCPREVLRVVVSARA
jgi:predicted MPP superfamily phosphohydrolase